MRTTGIILAVLLCGAIASAQQDGFGLGLIAGEPTGISGKLWIGHRAAFAAAAAWSFTDDAALHVHGDALIHGADLLGEEPRRLPVYYGLGARVKLGEDDSWLGLRIPLGLVYFFADAPLDLFLEVAPVMDLLPSTELSLNAAIGLRYYFSRREDRDTQQGSAVARPI